MTGRPAGVRIPRYRRELERAAVAAQRQRNADATEQLRQMRADGIASRRAEAARRQAEAAEQLEQAAAEQRLRDAETAAQLELAAAQLERHAAGVLRAGLVDDDLMHENPGAGTWASPMPVAAPAVREPTEADARVFAGLPGVAGRRPVSQEDRVRWSRDLDKPTTDRWRGSVR